MRVSKSFLNWLLACTSALLLILVFPRFNLTWLAYLGGRVMLKNRLSVSLGLYFQHVSNRYLNHINPGVNAVGPMLSMGWHF